MLKFILLFVYAISSITASIVAADHQNKTSYGLISPTIILSRAKRQRICSDDQWQCGDKTCIGVNYKCDGIFDCPDGSDETHALCKSSRCRSNWFQCSYGACVDRDAPCNGIKECADNSDELLSRCKDINATIKREDEGLWQCGDKTHIGVDYKCDGIFDCSDGSDETHALCRKSRCSSNWFRCTYGACVDGSAPCNGIKDCADNSDELLPRCKNITRTSEDIKFKCDNEDKIPSQKLCDGTRDCSDGSDETLRVCAGTTCAPHLFQCAYGACVDQGSDCNEKQDCADGSDESPELCKKSGFQPVNNNGLTLSTATSAYCLLPNYPENGLWTAPNEIFASPGKSYKQIYLQYTCNIGYELIGVADVTCIDGQFIQKIPTCARLCRMIRHYSIDYYCYSSNGIDRRRPCNDYEPQGTMARPKCKHNYYYYFNGDPPVIKCGVEGWSDSPICSPECGRVTPHGDTLAVGGQKAKLGELPWHAGIYRKNTTPYMQVCGGSIVRHNIVISAAHCFWTDNGKQSARLYAVGAGKLYRAWNDPGDKNPQMADVKSIEIPESYHGRTTNYAQDIAVLVLSVSFTYESHIAPVCLDFDDTFDNRQLTRRDSKGKVAGWGLVSEGNASPTLQVVELPIISYGDCSSLIPEDFRRYLTYDKICAGYIDKGTAVCQGDSGGGLVLPAPERSIERYYLRGVVSTSPSTGDHGCNSRTLSAFTRILSHADFIKRFI
ncbi:modular serine protease-like [Achroia grisella]|uniref:modular serine protease-like n=1 Tax=Achroia grisella TaxID=688607 RepID=UPI0027D2F47C|nr:modular serine protease-like [Achroia grisella]